MDHHTHNLQAPTLQWRMQSDAYDLYLTASSVGLTSILTTPRAVAMTSSLTDDLPQVRFLAQAVTELEQYFAGERREFDVALAPMGTPFQRAVWQQLRGIPYGKTCSYKDIAAAIGQPKAVRAVGSANGRNPLCIVIPCHRVIAADGSLGGYSGGLGLKSRLLDLEKNEAKH